MKRGDEPRWIVTSTYGRHYVEADSEYEAEERAEDQLREQGYADPANMILDGLTEQYDPSYHGAWMP